MNRRKFLAFAGGSLALGFVGKKAVSVFADSNTEQKKRWAMVIDLKKMQETPGLQDAMIEACHKLHNVPHIDSVKDEIKWIWKEKFKYAFIEQENKLLPSEILNKDVLLLCNHCDSPPCTHVCPTKATWRREEDGIVMMDWHRCVGCRYCMAACPYGSRSFNWFDPRKDIKEINPNFPTRTKGVVEKCTFCAELIVNGEYKTLDGKDNPPACVKACMAMNSDAIVFGDLKDENSEVRKVLSKHYSILRKPELGTHPEVYYLI